MNYQLSVAVICMGIVFITECMKQRTYLVAGCDVKESISVLPLNTSRADGPLGLNQPSGTLSSVHLSIFRGDGIAGVFGRRSLGLYRRLTQVTLCDSVLAGLIGQHLPLCRCLLKPL